MFTFEQLPDAIEALQSGDDIDYEGAAGAIDMDEAGDATAGVYDTSGLPRRPDDRRGSRGGGARGKVAADPGGLTGCVGDRSGRSLRFGGCTPVARRKRGATPHRTLVRSFAVLTHDRIPSSS